MKKLRNLSDIEKDLIEKMFAERHSFSIYRCSTTSASYDSEKLGVSLIVTYCQSPRIIYTIKSNYCTLLTLKGRLFFLPNKYTDMLDEIASAAINRSENSSKESKEKTISKILEL